MIRRFGLKILMGFVSLFLCCSLSSQVPYNLVPNYSFEENVKCANSLITDTVPYPWYLPTKFGSIFFHSCNTVYCAGVPHNCTGDTSFQYAKTGNGYIALFFRNRPNTNGRNYVQVKLTDSLRQGKCYYAEFFVSLLHLLGGCNNISMAVTPNQIWGDTIHSSQYYKVIPYNAQIYNYGNPIITDTFNWVKVSSLYVAQGGEQYITIGNFKYDSATLFQPIQPTGYPGAGYYVDDVSFVPLDSITLKADAGKDTSVIIGDSIFIGSLTNGITNIKWYNAAGQVIDTVRQGFYVTPTSNTFYVVEQVVCNQYSRDTVYVTVQAMPVHFVSFTGKKVNNSNLLQWRTATEQNNKGFELQRSIIGTEFSTIIFIPAKARDGNSTDILSYNYTDTKPFAGNNYYRLRQVDKDGKATLSNVVLIKGGEAGQLVLSALYPNPAWQTLNVVLNSPTAREVQLLITDIAGKTIQQQALQLQQGDNNQALNISALQKGSYIIKVICANGCEAAVSKFVKE